jgi:hypothetical protein
MFEHPIGKFSITGGTTVFGKPFVIAWVNDPETATAGEAVANRDLIKAAPELLDALKAMRRAVDAGVDADPAIWAEAATKSRAAILKAEGK